ncbi:MAG: OmpA family protein [Pontixanthobacter sp.]
MNTRNFRLGTAIASALFLAACDGDSGGDTRTPASEEAELPQPGDEPVSILRPEAEVEPDPILLEPLTRRISFDDGERQLSTAALAELDEVLQSEQMKAGGPIILRGHTDAGGSDDVNLRASERRAQRVADWLIENGVAENRITVIAMGEQNPARPNARPDGSPNEANRAYNRRVDLTIAIPAALKAEQEVEEQSFIERVSSDASDD